MKAEQTSQPQVGEEHRRFWEQEDDRQRPPEEDFDDQQGEKFQRDEAHANAMFEGHQTEMQLLLDVWQMFNSLGLGGADLGDVRAALEVASERENGFDRSRRLLANGCGR